MKAEKTPLRYIVQRIMRTIFNQDRQEGVATAGGYDNTFAVADCEVRGSSCLTIVIIARSKCAVKRVSCQLPSFFAKKRTPIRRSRGACFCLFAIVHVLAS